MKDEWLYLGHMLDLSRKAISLMQYKTRQQYDADEVLRLALVHLLQTIGEAARRVPEDQRLSHPEIPWRLITGMRHKIVHDYMEVDEDIVWDTVVQELPALVTILGTIVPQE